MTMSSTATGVRDRPRATGADLRAALLAASAWLDANAERINALNVFPVPDGDTGTNMSLTLQAAAQALQHQPESSRVGQVARAAYDAAMLGARGNSGVILSQLLRGFADALANETDLAPGSLARALTSASDAAYRGVSRPVEGTILTVARQAAAAAEQVAAAGADVSGTLERSQQAAGAAVAATPDQLDILRRAGVVDAGGEGYRVILEGLWLWSTGRSLDTPSHDVAPHGRVLFDDLEPSGSAETGFGFCTEFLLRDCDLPIADVKARMEDLGDSVLAVGDRDLLRVHVHTARPGQALEFAVDHGTLAKVKVENMQLQHEAMRAAGSFGPTDAGQPAASIGVVAVAAGDGFLKVFRSLGAVTVHGGQSMNPSVQDILAAIHSSGYRELVLLPNNSNVVLTARQAAEAAPQHTIAVVPTATVPQGIGALLAFNFQADLQTNTAAMQQAAHAVHTIEITHAVRAAEVDGIPVQAGQVLGIYDGQVVAAADAVEAALLGALGRAPVDALEIVTIYFGADADEAAAQAMAGHIREAHPGLAVEVIHGGQPHYPFVVSLE